MFIPSRQQMKACLASGRCRGQSTSRLVLFIFTSTPELCCPATEGISRREALKEQCASHACLYVNIPSPLFHASAILRRLHEICCHRDCCGAAIARLIKTSPPPPLPPSLRESQTRPVKEVSRAARDWRPTEPQLTSVEYRISVIRLKTPSSFSSSGCASISCWINSSMSLSLLK